MNTHTHIHTQAHSHKASTKKHNSTKVRVNESANRLHFPTRGSFSLLQKLNRKRLAVLSQGKGWERLPGPKYRRFLLLESRSEGTGQGCQLPPFIPHCVPRSWCNDLIWGREGVKGQWGGQKSDFSSTPFIFMIWFLLRVWHWCKTVLRLQVRGPLVHLVFPVDKG